MFVLCIDILYRIVILKIKHDVFILISICPGFWLAIRCDCKPKSGAALQSEIENRSQFQSGSGVDNSVQS